MNNNKQLKNLNKAMELFEEVYMLTAKFPGEEIYRPASQIRRCAISSSNLEPFSIAKIHLTTTIDLK